MRKIVSMLLLLFVSVVYSQAQELNAKVTVNSDRIQSTDKNIFDSLEKALFQLINDEKWSSTTLSTIEKIECSFSLIILEQITENSFKAELSVQSRRPVYNSSYTTTILNWRETGLEFDYIENSALVFDRNSIGSNLIATIAFYSNLILALDFESFSPSGGAVFFRQAQAIAMQAQSSSWAGWSAFDDNKSKTSIINAYSDTSMSPFRELWYTYHRKALDEMASNADRGRTTILNALPALKEVKNVRGSEIVLQMFADCKLDEIVSIADKATSEEKKELYGLLRNLYPSMSNQFNSLNK